MDTRRLTLLLSGLKVCGEISPDIANSGEFATLVRHLGRGMSRYQMGIPSNRSVSVRGARLKSPDLVWAIDFQFDSTTDGKAIKIASMVDEHTRESLLHLVERSITAERLVAELEKVFTARGGPPKVLRMDNGPELVSQALQQFCAGKVGMSYIPPGTPWNNGYIESFNNRLRKECLNRNHWNTAFEARVVIGNFKDEHNHRHRHSALGYRTPSHQPC